MGNNRDKAEKRLMVILALAFILFIAMIARLFYWQVIKGEELKRGALSQWTKGITLKPKRGVIYDRTGKKLAVSQTSSTVWVSLAEVDQDKKDKTIKILSNTLNMEEKELRDIFKESSGHRKVKQWITKEEKSSLEKALKESSKKKEKITGIQIVDDSRRYYPYNNFASHVIGFTDIDGNGLYGVEKTYDSYLSGSAGKWIKTTDTGGRQLPFDTDELHEAKDGLSLVLTLDETIQRISEEVVNRAMSRHKAANIAVIAMEPKTGEILAMVNKPDYNPNNPKTSLDENIQKRWTEMAENGEHKELQEEWYDSWRNFSLNDVYEPGSTFKLITAAAALEENIVSPTTPFYCNGYIGGIKGENLKCTRAHGDINFQRGMDVSCNTVFVKTARMMGKETFLKYIKAFGFGEKTDIDLNGEQYGLVPSKASDIKDVNLATMSYGYGVALTPMQMINAIATISNGGNLMRPHIVKSIVDSEGRIVEEFKPEVRRRVISEETSKVMLELMDSVVSKGSGRHAKIAGFNIGGKTGTAKKAINGRYVDGKYIGSFGATVPTDDPQVSLLVVIDDPKGVYYGGSTAAPLAREIIQGILSYLEIEPEGEREKKKVSSNEIVEVPNVVGKTIGEAGALLNEAGLKHMTDYVDIDSNSIVSSQSPEGGKKVHKNNVVDLELKNVEVKKEENKQKENKKKKPNKKKKDIKIPNLKGKKKDEIERILKRLNVDYIIEGKGVCIEQSVEAGTVVNDEMILKIKLK